MATRLTTSVVAALLLVLLPACGGGRDALTIYSGRGENLVGPILERFNEATGIPIDVRYGDSSELALLISEEGDRSPADVFYSQSPGATGFLASEDRLAVLPDDLLRLVDPRFESPEGTWVGITGRQRVLVHNTDMVGEDELPASVYDLTEPPWEGRVAIAPANGSFHDFVTAMRQVDGEDTAAAWLEGMAADDAPVYANNNAIVEAVGRGEVPMGLVNHYYALRFLEEDPTLPVANHRFPGDDIGALLIASTASVLEGSDKADEAAELVEFLLSPDAQAFFATETFEYPLAADVELAADAPPLETLDVPAFDLSDLGGGLEATLALIRDSGFDV